MILNSPSLDFNNVIWCTSNDFTELFQCGDCNVTILFQRIQRFIVNAAFDQMILRHLLFFHGFP